MNLNQYIGDRWNELYVSDLCLPVQSGGWSIINEMDEVMLDTDWGSWTDRQVKDKSLSSIITTT